MKNENTIPAVDRALSAIEYMCMAERPVSQAEITRASGVTATTGYRIVQSLMKHNWIRRNRNNTYSLSLGMLSVLMKSKNHGVFFGNVQPILDELAAKTKLACKLSIRQWEEQVSILRAESPEPFSVAGKNGMRFPVIEGSVGAALLCRESEESIYELAEKCKEDLPEKRNPELVLERVRQIRSKGYIFNQGNNRWRVDAMSMPLIDSMNQVAGAVTLLGIREDFTERNLPFRAELLKQAVEQIQSEL